MTVAPESNRFHWHSFPSHFRLRDKPHCAAPVYTFSPSDPMPRRDTTPHAADDEEKRELRAFTKEQLRIVAKAAARNYPDIAQLSGSRVLVPNENANGNRLIAAPHAAPGA